MHAGRVCPRVNDELLFQIASVCIEFQIDTLPHIAVDDLTERMDVCVPLGRVRADEVVESSRQLPPCLDDWFCCGPTSFCMKTIRSSSVLADFCGPGTLPIVPL